MAIFVALLLIQLATVNLDRTLVGSDKMIYVQPPVGVTWEIQTGSLMTERPVRDGGLTVWLESPPYHPYRNPSTGEMIGCETCVTLIRESTDERTFFPIVNSYGDGLRGLEPILISFPDRMMIAVHGLATNESLRVWVRFTVKSELP